PDRNRNPTRFHDFTVPRFHDFTIQRYFTFHVSPVSGPSAQAGCHPGHETPPATTPSQQCGEPHAACLETQRPAPRAFQRQLEYPPLGSRWPSRADALDPEQAPPPATERCHIGKTPSAAAQ